MAGMPSQHLHVVHLTKATKGHGLKLAAFRYPNYCLFWVGQLVTNVGSWMQVVATGWLIVQISGSAAALGFNGAFQALPIIIFSMIGGGVAHRGGPYRLVVLTRVVPNPPPGGPPRLVAPGPRG